jgi:hypothetical protein
MSADTISSSTGLPEYIAPAISDLIGYTSSLLDYNLSDDGYPIYEGDRLAPFSDLQKAAQTGIASLGPSSYLSDAKTLAQHFGDAAKTASYTPNTITSQTVSATPLGRAQGISAGQASAAQLGGAPTAQAAQFAGPAAVQAQTVNNQRVNAPSLRDLQMRAATAQYDPRLQQYQMGPAQQVSGQQITADRINAATSQYNPAASLQQYQMGPAERVSTDKFTQPGTAEEYMSPYIQRVLDTQRREAVRADDIARQQRGARAVAAGAYGGSRQAIEEAEANRNLQTRLNDIEAAGLQKAYESAQSQFTSDQARALQAGTANQQAGLTTGAQNLAAQLGVQGLGTQAGMQLALANLSNEQQAAVQNAANQLQARGMTAQQAMQAALANQGAGLTVGQQNLAANLATQQLGANIGSQFGLANLQNQQQTNAQNLSAALQTQALGAQTGMQAEQLNQQANMQAQLANQQAGLQAGQFNAQMGYNTGLQNAQMRQQAELANQQMAGQYGLTGAQLANQAALQNAQLATQAGIAGAQLQGQYDITGAQQALQASLANQDANLKAQQLQEQADQFGANYGIQQAGIGLNAASQMGNLGYTDFQQNLGALNAQNLIGAQVQQQEQNFLNQQYQDFLNQQQYPWQQLANANAIYRGYPMGGNTNQVTTFGQPSALQTAVGVGTGLIGLSKLGGAEGGQVRAPRSSGLADLMISKLN